MNGEHRDPARLREQVGQSNVVERIAGQAARDMPEPEPLSNIGMARIAARIEAQRNRNVRLPSRGWILAMGGFLLGIATAASAAHLDLVPRWLTRIVQGPPESAPTKPAPKSVKPRPPTRAEAPIIAPKTVDEAASDLGSPAEPPAAGGLAAPVAPGVAPEHSKQATLPAPRATTGHRPTAIASAEQRAGVQSVGKTPRSLPFIAWHDSPTAGIAGAQGEARAPLVAQQPGILARPADEPIRRPSAVEPAWAPPTAVAIPSGPPWTAASVALRAPTVRATTTGAPNGSTSPNRPAPTSQSATAAILHDIVRALRVEHSPRHALGLLDQHASELAGDAFSEESLLLRVEAMLALGQRDAVLRLLDHTALTDLGVSNSLLITRGELRAAVHRCAEGIGDFELMLTGSRKPPKQALLGHARCKQQLGDLAGAQADFERYRRAFGEEPPR